MLVITPSYSKSLESFREFRPKLWKFLSYPKEKIISLKFTTSIILASYKLAQFWSKLDKVDIFVIRSIEFHHKESISERKKKQNLAAG